MSNMGPPVLKRKSDPPPDDDVREGKKKKKIRVHADEPEPDDPPVAIEQLDDDEPQPEDDADALRDEGPFWMYAFIEKVENERAPQGVRIKHLLMSCISGEWFDELADDLSDMPPSNTIARDAATLSVELTITNDELAAISREVPHLQDNWWVAVAFRPPSHEDWGVVVAAYRPADGSVDPSTIGTTGNSIVTKVVAIRRVRPPSLLAKLFRFSNRSMRDVDDD